jgi:hypothetical protein
MEITSTMSIFDLAQRMGSDATDTQASTMRDLLVARHDGRDTADIDEAEWNALLDQAATDAMQTADGILEHAGVKLADLCIRQHEQGYAWLAVHIDDGLVLDTEWREDVGQTESYISANWHVLIRVGTGSCPCNCDACGAGDAPADWAGDDADAQSAMHDEIDETLNNLIA